MFDVIKARKKIDKVLLEWFLSDPIMLGVWCLVDKKESKDQDTIGIDTRSNPPCIKYNPNFINSISQEKLELVMASEGFKLLLRHPTTRLINPKTISALSSTVTVNQMLNANLRSLFKDDVNFDKIMEEFNLKPDKYFEEYFRNIIDQQEKVEDFVSEMFGDEGDGQGEESGGASGDDDRDEDGFKKYGQGDSPLKDYLNPNGTSNKDWGENTLLDADVQNFVNEKKGSSTQWGKHTGDYLGDIVAANTPKISYKEVIRRFNTSVMSTVTVSSRMKVNRRYDLLFSGYRRKYKCKIIFAIDCSGSMSDEDLQEGFSVINSVCKHAEITYILFDTQIKLVEKKFKKAKKTFKVTGRGGTDFQDVCDYAQDNMADGLVIYTDGYASPPTKPKNTKVLWLLNSKEGHPPVDWGFVAHLDRYEK